MALVSVIIPTYNRRSLVVEAVDCVLRQTIKDIEVIVVDDGSTDSFGKWRYRLLSRCDATVAIAASGTAGGKCQIY